MVGQVLDLPQDLREPDTLAEVVSDLWIQWDSARHEWKRLTKEVEEYVFATDTQKTSNSRNPWSHTTHRPKMAQLYDNLTSNYLHATMPHSEWLNFESFDEDASVLDIRKRVLGYLNTKHRLINFYEVVESLLSDWVLKGNCFVKLEYVVDDFGYTGPKPTRIIPEDIVFNPLARSFESSPKIVRSTKTIGDLIQESEDQAWPQDEKAVLEKMRDLRQLNHQGYSETIDAAYALQIGGFGSFSEYLGSGYVEVLDFYGDYYDSVNDEYLRNKHIRIFDRTRVVRMEDINTWDKTPHIYHSGWRPRSNNLWQMSPLENLVGMQYMINHLENSRADAFDQMIHPDIQIVGDVEVVENDDGSREYWVASERGSVRYIHPDTTVLNADLKIQELENLMELYAGAPREAMGIRTPGEKTRFEVQQLTTAASRIFQGKINKFERSILEKMVNAEIELAKENLDGIDTIKVQDAGTGVSQFIEITREDLKANGKVIPIGARHYARQAQLAQEFTNFHQLAMLDEEIKIHFPATKLAERWAELLGEESLYEQYGRVPERLEAQRQMSAAEETLQVEQAVQPEPDLV